VSIGRWQTITSSLYGLTQVLVIISDQRDTKLAILLDSPSHNTHASRSSFLHGSELSSIGRCTLVVCSGIRSPVCRSSALGLISSWTVIGLSSSKSVARNQ
jgi:hypothetical protein